MKKYFILVLLQFMLVPILAWAEGTPPQVTSYTFNEKTESVILAPTGSITINLTADRPVKFSTVAVCHKEDDVCSRSTSVKYFTQSSAYENSLSRQWDGLTGGSNPTAVPNGEYKIKVTIKDEVGLEGIQDLSPYFITIDSSATTSEGDLNKIGTTTEKTAETNSSSSGHTSSVSTHSVQTDLSDYETTLPKVGAGRDRYVVVGAVVDFMAQVNKTTETGKYAWNFGDGQTAIGEKVSHAYKFPGKYNVVLNASFSTGPAVARTVVKVSIPNVAISEVSSKDQYVEIKNNDESEINLKDWVLKTTNQEFVFPADTIISPSSKIKFPIEVSNLNLSVNQELSLIGPGKQVFSNLKISAPTVASSAELLEIYQKLVQIKTVLASNNFSAKVGESYNSAVTLVSFETVTPVVSSSATSSVITFNKKPGLIQKSLNFFGHLFK